jgi:DNA-binding GntR family transcriptional regulator
MPSRLTIKSAEAPVREALRQLEAEGLTTIIPNRGAVVPPLSQDDIEELFSIRYLLEPEALRRSIPHLTEEDLSRAEAILKSFMSEIGRDGRLLSWGRLNWEFHATLYSKAANQPRLMMMIRNTNNSGGRYTVCSLP